MPTPPIGSPAPWPAGITNQDGKAVHLADYAGKNVLLYFYPKDDTPGCTIEACNLRDHLPQLRNTVVLGASLDSAASHQAFRAKFNLPFDLLVDPDQALAKAYGALLPDKKNPSRMSVLINPEGKVALVWAKVDPKTHHQEVLAAVG